MFNIVSYLKRYCYRYASEWIMELDQASPKDYECLLTKNVFCKNGYFVEAFIDQN